MLTSAEGLKSSPAAIGSLSLGCSRYLKAKGRSFTASVVESICVKLGVSVSSSSMEETELYQDLAMMGERMYFPSWEGRCQFHHILLKEGGPILPSVT